MEVGEREDNSYLLLVLLMKSHLILMTYEGEDTIHMS